MPPHPSLPPSAHPRQAKAAAADPSAPKVKFNRLLLRFGTLHEGFAASKRVFRELVGVEGGELSLEQLRPACASLGYHLDEATLHSIFAGADMDGSRTLNVHEFLATMAIVHSLRVSQAGRRGRPLSPAGPACPPPPPPHQRVWVRRWHGGAHGRQG